MIPVTLQKEPADFDVKVRQPGQAWLANKGIALTAAPPKGTILKNCWTHSNKQLWTSYSGVCAYLAIYFEWVTGASSTDHFVAKSTHAGDAYEWKNYRLSAMGPNRNKNKYDDVIDPIGMAADTFVLNLSNGKIRPNPGLSTSAKAAGRKTIKRLKLDSPEHNEMRASHYRTYLRYQDPPTLKDLNPFVWHEADRQGLL